MATKETTTDQESAASKALVRHEKDGDIRALHSTAPGKELSIGRRMLPLSSSLWLRSLRSVFASSFCGISYVASLLLLSLMTIHSPLPLHAQTGTATLSGIVTDESGAILPNCEIQLQSIARGNVITTKTNNDGIYVFSSVQPGPYNLTIRRNGFKQVDFLNLLLNTQDHVQQNFRLQVGSVSESVTVNANLEYMETDNPAVGLLVDRTFVENMPLNGRSFQDLIALAPGIVTAQDARGLFSVNGQHDNSNYYSVDGVAANLSPGIVNNSQSSQGLSGTVPGQTALGTTQTLASVDALQEFKIQTSGYTAEYGRQPGGQIALTTRSGTNDVHGSVFDYFRNNVLDANDWFLNSQGIPNPGERQNDFGGTIGGPLTVPKVYNGKDRTFYFVSYEGLRLRQPQASGVQAVPTVAFRQFAAPGVQPFLNATPLPNGPDNGDQCALSLGFTFSCTGQWAAGYSNPSTIDATSVRLDQAMGRKLQLFFRYSETLSDSAIGVTSEEDTRASSAHAWTVGSTMQVTSSLLDELRFNYSQSSFVLTTTPTPFDGAVPFAKNLVLPAAYAPGSAPSQGGVNENVPIANSFYIPQYDRNFTAQHQYNLVNSISWTHGSHALKFGGDYRRLTPSYNPEQYIAELNLNSLASAQQGFADMAFIQAGQNGHPVFSNLSVYAQDHWRVTSRLTLDYGVRWEYNPAPGASDGIYPLALTTANLSSAQVAPTGTQQYRTVYHNFAPRFGFAYQINSDQSRLLVVRGGVGTFYDTGQAQGALGYTGYPFSVLRVGSDVPLPASAVDLAPPALKASLVPPYQFINGVSDPTLKVPYAEQWNLSLDRGLGAKNTLTMSYVGNAGKRLLFSEVFDNLSSINPLFTGLQLTSNSAASTYHALQIQDHGYIAPGAELIASYTWAHAIDNASTDSSGSAPLRGNSDNDIRHVLNVALNYRVPAAESNKVLRSLTGGWSLDNRLTALSGYPVDVFQNTYFLPNGGQATIRPDLVPGVPIYLHGVPNVLGGWMLNSAAFNPVPTDPNTGAPLRQGDLGRNSIHGPAFWNLNSAVQRGFPIHDRLQLLFRVDAFNIFNHPNAGGIANCLCYGPIFGQSNAALTKGGVPTIGTPNQLYGTGAARSLQLMLKLQF